MMLRSSLSSRALRAMLVLAGLLATCIVLTQRAFSETDSTPELDRLILGNVRSGYAEKVLERHGKSAYDRYRVIEAFSELSSLHSRKSLEAVIWVAETTKNLTIRRKAIEAIGIMLYLDPPAALAALQRGMSRDNADERIDAIRAIGSAGPEAKSAIPLLISALQDRGTGSDLEC